MKISQLVIYGYGRWQDKVITIDQNFVAFLGQNEMGKSTLQSFIQSMLFGLPKNTRKKDVNLYVPKVGSAYGGKMVLEDTPYGTIVIERVRGNKASVDEKIVTRSGQQLTQEEIDVLFAGVSLPLFQQFFSITLDQLHDLKTVQKEDLNRYFLTVGLSGSEALFDWHDEWLSLSDKLYRPNGSKLPLNQQLEYYKQQADLVEQLAQKQRGYAQRVQQRQDIAEQLEKLQQSEEKVRDQLQNVQVLQQLQPAYERWQLLSNRTYRTTQLREHIGRDYQAIKIEKASALERLTQAKERVEWVDAPEELQWFIAHDKAIKYAVMSLPKVEQILKNIAMADYQKDIQQEALNEALTRLKLTVDQLPSEQVVLDGAAEQLLQKERLLVQERDVVRVTIQQLNVQLSDSQLQERLLHEQHAKEHNQSRLAAKEAPRLTGYVLGMLCGVVGVVAGVLLSQWLVSGLGALVAIVCSGVAFVRRSNYNRQQQLIQLQEHQRIENLQQRLAHQIAVSQAIQTRLDEAIQQQTRLQQEIVQVHQEMSVYKQVHGIVDELPLESIQNGDVTHAQRVLAKLNHLEQDKQIAEQQLGHYDDVYAFFDAQLEGTFDGTLTARRQRLTQFKAFVDTWQVRALEFHEKDKSVQVHQRDVQSIQQHLQQLDQKEQQLFKEANVTTAVAFEQLMQHQEEETKLQKEKSLLQEQLEPYMVQLTASALEDTMHLNEQLKQLISQKEQLLMQQAAINQEIHFLEKDGEYAKEKQKLAQLEEETLAMIQQVAVYHHAAQLIEWVLQYGKSSNVDSILVLTSQLFERLTNGRYIQLDFQDVLRVKRYDETWFELHELSTGTLDQLYIVLRLAFIKSIEERVSLPIIIDDCFVNFDEQRQEAMLGILEEFAQTHQIIYLTYSSRVIQTSAQVVELQTI